MTGRLGHRLAANPDAGFDAFACFRYLLNNEPD